MKGSIVFGVVGGTVEAPEVAYLRQPQPMTDELRTLAHPVKPTEVYRIASPCIGGACQHFDGADCRLAKRIVKWLPITVTDLPPCQVRPSCRWWQQEGKSACLRCPQVVTENYYLTERLKRAIHPTSEE